MTDSQYGTIERLRRKSRWILRQAVIGRASPNKLHSYRNRYLRNCNKTGKLAGKFMGIQ